MQFNYVARRSTSGSDVSGDASLNFPSAHLRLGMLLPRNCHRYVFIWVCKEVDKRMKGALRVQEAVYRMPSACPAEYVHTLRYKGAQASGGTT